MSHFDFPVIFLKHVISAAVILLLYTYSELPPGTIITIVLHRALVWKGRYHTNTVDVQPNEAMLLVLRILKTTLLLQLHVSCKIVSLVLKWQGATVKE